jgi:hypothetical protein
LFCAKVVVENSFDILKKTFKELLIKSNLNVLFLPNVVVCCCMLHNMILSGKDIDIDKLIFHLELEDMLENNRRCEEERP